MATPNLPIKLPEGQSTVYQKSQETQSLAAEEDNVMYTERKDSNQNVQRFMLEESKRALRHTEVANNDLQDYNNVSLTRSKQSDNGFDQVLSSE